MNVGCYFVRSHVRSWEAYYYSVLINILFGTRESKKIHVNVFNSSCCCLVPTLLLSLTSQNLVFLYSEVFSNDPRETSVLSDSEKLKDCKGKI